MPRTALIIAARVAAMAALASWGAAAGSPHLDPGRVRAGCPACHTGHGASRSPMLGEPQVTLCLRCHGSRGDADSEARRGVLAPAASPPLLGTALAQPWTHPLTRDAFSSEEVGAITCTSCHAPHRGVSTGLGATATAAAGVQRVSPRDPTQLEYQLCEGCHGSAGSATQSLLDMSRLLSPANRSFHPVEGVAAERSPSLLPGLSGKEINCTDCHGNSDAQGPRGPHGSAFPGLLRFNFTASDGTPESVATYTLCYACHDRKAVLAGASFPEHRMHIVEEQASCATCHNSHGSVGNRALIRFGEETTLAGVTPAASGKLAFVSTGPGSGQCYLTCHGANHDPLGYGNGSAQTELLTPVLGRAVRRTLRALPGPAPARTDHNPKHRDGKPYVP